MSVEITARQPIHLIVFEPEKRGIPMPVTKSKAKPSRARKRTLLGEYIVADPDICHGKPTFIGTRVMVWQVLEMVSEGMAWDEISHQWHDKVSKEAIAEAIELAQRAFVDHATKYGKERQSA
jgi:uncharacterized protein (DUF433 family)